MIDEQKLLHSLKKKNRSSLNDIVKLYTPYLSVVIYNAVGGIVTAEDIEEIISDCFFQLWQHANNICAEKGCIRTYLGAIARNSAKNKLRKIQLCKEIDENILSEQSDPLDKMIENEEKTFLLDMIAALGEPDSEIFLRYYYYDETIKTIASILGIPPSTVKTKLFRGKTKLKNLIMKRRGNDEYTFGKIAK